MPAHKMRFASHITLPLVTAAILGAMICGGCKSAAEKQREAEALRTSTPLPHDPTDEVELSRWWSNGRQLLELRPDSSYALREGLNRYASPTQRGRWSQQGYAVLWLEPYTVKHQEPVRVSITRMGGQLALRLPRMTPMRPLAQPPAVDEDRFAGRWTSDTAALRLGANMRYALTPVAGSEPDGPVTAGHNGVWRIDGEAVMLHPDSPVVKPLRLEITGDGDAMTLTAGEVAFSRDGSSS